MKYYLSLIKSRLWPQRKKRPSHTIVSTNNKIKKINKTRNERNGSGVPSDSLLTQENGKKNLKRMQLANKINLNHFINIKFEMNNIKYNEIRRYYLNNSNNFINSDGLKCNIVSAINCHDNILFYLFVFSFTNIKNNFLELIQIHIKNSKTNETVSKDVPFVIVSLNDSKNIDHPPFQHTSNNHKLFSNVKIAIKIQENIKISKYANENTSIQDVSMDSIFYVIEYRMWNTYYELNQN
ncbi:conserved Plasmodium protein, unknown function [Plasmodium chabaudi chabaudi]|uniref:Uncharacterized protein n=1 Tax=Plasmodium chabaudi chabaudi TaxID=31271 RepID=A0A077XB16_PLACU|nr:conserved Plasmodium protein, unknown function [Plasmodium chabaudi chabaudi]SCL99018.1 conserved Plasmodium protein, unknown function [Plasmodium chabaudi chabaudi]SCL99904.1 conserved Plasmodium protein, unknown function [Plasmodium chabaudi chabaudi]VTZ67372.1 conserved Plasmodium protein, unknown function [Plasmodium chabaudi chabaudi]|eukprot:XP_746118.2 conserved Plasmodium protein, unknown function [Plasmodium chabaudi chabaudi]